MGARALHTQAGWATGLHGQLPAAPEPAFPGQLLRKRAALHPSPQTRKVFPPQGPAQTQPPGRSLLGTRCHLGHQGWMPPLPLSPRKFCFKKKRARSPQIGSAKCIPQAGPPQGAQREQVKEKPRDASVVKREQGSRSHPSLGQVDSSPANPAESPSRAGTCHMSKATSEKVCRAKRGHRSLPAVLAPQADPAPSPQPPRAEWA